jgi:hypothetical protein
VLLLIIRTPPQLLQQKVLLPHQQQPSASSYPTASSITLSQSPCFLQLSTSFSPSVVFPTVLLDSSFTFVVVEPPIGECGSDAGLVIKSNCIRVTEVGEMFSPGCGSEGSEIFLDLEREGEAIRSHSCRYRYSTCILLSSGSFLTLITLDCGNLD